MAADDLVRRALAAVAEADASRHPPERVERALLDAFDRDRHARRRSWRSVAARWPRLAAGVVLALEAGAAVAVLALVVTGAAYVWTREGAVSGPRLPERPTQSLGRDRQLLPEEAAAGPVVPADWQSDTIVRVARLRIPRAMLPMLGVPIIEPDGTGTIEIEVLVGDDGLARAVRILRSRGQPRD